MRALFVSLALSIAPAALACGGHDCGGACPMAAARSASDDGATVAADVAGARLKLSISGVHCAMSAGQVQAALLEVEGVNGVAVNTAGKAEIAYDAEKVDQAALVAAVDALEGYSAAVPTEG